MAIWASAVGTEASAGRPNSVGLSATWTWYSSASTVMPANMLIEITPMMASDCASLRLLGLRKAGTPLLIASTPVRAVQPEAKARMPRKTRARRVKAPGAWIGRPADSARIVSPVARRTAAKANIA